MQTSELVENSLLVIEGVHLEMTRYTGWRSAAPTLVLLHEGLGCVAMWKDFPEKLAGLTGCPVLAYSRQGYGRSDPWSTPPGLDYLQREGVEILPKVLAAADIGEHILVGHSDGGSIALIYAGSVAGPELLAVVTMAAHVFCESLTLESIAYAQENYKALEINQGLQKYHADKTHYVFWGWSNIWRTPELSNGILDTTCLLLAFHSW